MTEQQKMNKLAAVWSTDSVLGIRSLFGVEPTGQQIDFIMSAWDKDARVAVSSCQGAGKTSTLVWLVFLFLLTQKDCRILVTSPSHQQLSRVFHAELKKWHHQMPAIFQKQFVITKEKVGMKGREDIQRADLVTANAEATENLQGGHSDSYIVLVDEASGVDEKVFDLLMGTLGVGESQRFIMTSNPLHSMGRFYEAFKKKWSGWALHYFDAYNAPRSKQKWIDEMEEIYGKDHDIFRVRVLGRFPRASSTQFFPTNLVEQARLTSVNEFVYQRYPKIGGCDVARFGDDKTVFVVRQGPKLLDITIMAGLDTMEVAGRLLEYQRKWNCQAINIDAIGIGAGVYDRAKQLGMPVHQVIVSQRSTNPTQFMNLRSQLYGCTKEWLANGADIPNQPKDIAEQLEAQLASIQYGYNKKMQIQMLGKKEIKRQGLPSPDIVDAITLTQLQTAFQAVGNVTSTPREIVQSNYCFA